MTSPILLTEKAEFAIKAKVKEDFFKGRAEALTRQEVRDIIVKTVKQMPDTMKNQTAQALFNLYNKCRRSLLIMPPDAVMLLSAMKKTVGEVPAIPITKTKAQRVISASAYPHGVPLKIYMKDYIDQHVKPALDTLAKQNATVARQSLRNKAEMQVRYDNHLDQLLEMKEKGVRLVIVSSHANCSERCRPYQGKVFSLDGTSGKTDDGRKYEPIENAINVPAKSKSGKIYPYFNGLFGFNCRHYLVEYKPGYRFPTIPREVDAKYYAIDQEQRKYERNIRRLKSEAEAWRGVDNMKAMAYKKQATALFNKYVAFSKKNEVSYYYSRTTII